MGRIGAEGVGGFTSPLTDEVDIVCLQLIYVQEQFFLVGFYVSRVDILIIVFPFVKNFSLGISSRFAIKRHVLIIFKLHVNRSFIYFSRL